MKITSVRFNRNSFVIDVNQYGYIPDCSIGVNAQIENVFPSAFDSKNSTRWKVTIQAGINEYSFAHGLSKAECMWLAQEIKDWLSLN